MVNLGDFSGINIGEIFPADKYNKFEEWREADLMKKELDKKYNDKYPNSGEVFNVIKAFGNTPPDCVQLDEKIKEISYDIEQLGKTTPTLTSGLDIIKSKNPDILKLYLLREILLENKKAFNKNICTDVLEKKKIEDNAKMLTKESAKTEKKVLEKGTKEQYLYIGYGAVILLVGLFIVTRNKK
jgi:hypothetical protein